jgi:hypothetical protein
VDGHAVVVFGDGDAEGAQVGGHGGDAVGFLDAQFVGVADFGVALGQRAGHGDDGQFVDDVGDFRAGNFRAAQLASVDADGAERFAGGIGCFRDMGAHAQQHAEQAGAGAVEAEVGDGQVGAGHGGGGGDPEGGGGKVARHVEVAPVQPRASAHPDRPALGHRGEVDDGRRVEMGEQPLGMIARGVFSVTLVVPVAKRPASRRHDFNCALATGSVYSMPVSGPP